MKKGRAGKRFLIGLVGLFLSLTIFPFWGYAAIPQIINYQGFLTDSGGNPVNGTVQMRFSIYNVPTGGSPLWSETQSVAVTSGVFSVNLGGATPIDLPFDTPYYLGVAVGTDSEMGPRKPLTSMGYAFRAKTVEEGSGGGGSITGVTAGTGLTGGGTTGNVTLSVDTKAIQRRVSGICPTGTFVKQIYEDGTTECVAGGSGGAGSITGITAGTGLTGGGTAGNVTLGIQVPLELSGSATYGFYPGIIKGTDSQSGNFGYLGGRYYGVYGQANADAFGSLGYEKKGVYGSAYEGGYGVYGYAQDNISTAVYGIGSGGNGCLGCGGSSQPTFWTTGNSGAGVEGSNSYSPAFGALGTDSFGAYGSYGRTILGTGNYGALGGKDFGVYGESSAIVDGSKSGTHGWIGTKDYGAAGCDDATGNCGGLGSANQGVAGRYGTDGNYGNLGSENAGVIGYYADTGDYGALGSKWGAVAAYSEKGYCFEGNGAIGLYLDVTGDAIQAQSRTGKAGVFNGPVEIDGNLRVNGSISKSSGSFKIDHPLDPENEYLYHSLVESPDMKNIYDGLVVLDSNGEAWVELPTWFEALNKDFRYQLTAIGAPGPNIYIAEEISKNRFLIAGGRPGMKVSWQVAGTRKDPYAEAHRTPVEVEKPPEARGYYLDPEVYGKPKEKGEMWARELERMKRSEEMREEMSNSIQQIAPKGFKRPRIQGIK